MRLNRTSCLLIAALLLASCRRGSSKEVTIGIAIPSYVHAVAWIAHDKGMFREAGVRTRVDVMGGSAATARSLIAGSTQIGLLGGDVVLKANAAGADLVIVAGLVNRFYHRLIGRAGVRRMADLRGGKIGLPFLGGPQDMAVRYALHEHGLSYGKDVKIFNLGREMNRIAALTRGDIDATTSQTPLSRLATLGFHVLDDLPARPVAFPYLMVVVKRSYLASHSERVRAALRGLCRAVKFYRSEQDASLALIGKYIHGSDATKAANERYRHSGPSLLSWPPLPDKRGLEMVRGFLRKKARSIDPKDVIDLTILDELRRRGECGGA